MEHRFDELASYIESHADPVLKAHLEGLNDEAVPVMKKHRDLLGNRWHDRFMAVRNTTLFYADTPAAATNLAASRSRAPRDEHVIELKGCRVENCAMETDGSHWAFKLHTPQVMMQGNGTACICSIFCRGGSCCGRPAMLRSEWPSWRPSAVAPRPLLHPLSSKACHIYLHHTPHLRSLMPQVATMTSAGFCWARRRLPLEAKKTSPSRSSVET
jgi:hypothetical protein